MADITVSANIDTLLQAPDFASVRSTLELVVGTNIQAYSSELAALAVLTGSTYGRDFVQLADASAGRTKLGVVIGTNVQAYSATLGTLAASNPFTQGTGITFSGTWPNITISGSAAINQTAWDAFWDASARPDDYALTSEVLAGFAPISNPTFTGTVGGVTAAMVGLANVNNTSDASKPVSTAQAAAIVTERSATRTLTNARVTRRSTPPPTYGTTTSVDSDVLDAANITATGNITTLTISGTPTDGQVLAVNITASGADRTVALGSAFKIPASSAVTSPITIASGTETRMALVWKAATSKWQVASLVPGY